VHQNWRGLRKVVGTSHVSITKRLGAFPSPTVMEVSFYAFVSIGGGPMRMDRR
jgi:hypothetical protein